MVEKLQSFFYLHNYVHSLIPSCNNTQAKQSSYDLKVHTKNLETSDQGYRLAVSNKVSSKILKTILQEKKEKKNSK